MPHASWLRVGFFQMSKALKRCYGQGHLHLLTFRCYRRLPLLGLLKELCDIRMSRAASKPIGIPPLVRANVWVGTEFEQ